jgi:hypothetical protein
MFKFKITYDVQWILNNIRKIDPYYDTIPWYVQENKEAFI